MIKDILLRQRFNSVPRQEGIKTKEVFGEGKGI